MNPQDPSPSAPPVRTQAELERHWRRLVTPLGFAGRSLWLLLIDADGCPAPVAVEIEDAPQRPVDGDVDALGAMCEHFVGDQAGGGSVAFLLTEPGTGGPSEGVKLWSRALQGAVDRRALIGWPVHWANDVQLAACSPDHLAG